MFLSLFCFLFSQHANAEEAVAPPAESPPPPPINMAGVRVGYALAPVQDHLLTGPMVGLAYLFQTNHLQIGFRPLEIGWATQGEDASALSVRFLRFEGAYIFRPNDGLSLYAGGGLGFALQLVSDDAGDPAGGGVELPVQVGAEILRRQNIRFSVEAEGILPLYRLKDAYDQPAGWPYSVGLRLGVSVKMKRTLPEVIGAWLN